MKNFIQINSQDNVAVALLELKSGTSCQLENGQEIILQQDIARGHKFALTALVPEQNIIKYGNPIGHATQIISPGEWVHNHNLKTNLSAISTYNYQMSSTQQNNAYDSRSFQGYRRGDGRVGIRNELWIIPTVGCVNGVAAQIKAEFLQRQNAALENIDCINILSHNYGCSQLGDDHVNTRTILAAAAQHPNCAGALIVGLGCENNTMREFKLSLGDFDDTRIKSLITQEVSDEVSSGVALLEEIYQLARQDQRQTCPLSDLQIGLKCGASDGLSGITANPLVGAFSDFVVQNGGSSILTEVPEMFGAEHLLMQRAVNQEIFDDIVELINNFKRYFIKHEQPVYENPSPGNKAGGISTLEDKSLGCTQKAGTSLVSGVLEYGQRLVNNGLNLLNAPGNDLVASSALAASGCQLVLFTTGRGTPFGSIVPTVKIATNSAISQLKPRWIDFNAGQLIEDAEFDSVLNQFIDYILAVASGKPVNNELNNSRELAIFKTGVTL